MSGNLDNESPENTTVTLGVLSAVSDNSRVTQRMLANELGIALGLVNSYLKRCVRKGYIKVRQVPKNRFAYYLTPEGFYEKSRLTAEFLSQSLKFYRIARNQCTEHLEACVANGWHSIIFVGSGDLAEIGAICAQNYQVEVLGVLSPDGAASAVPGQRALSDLDDLKKADAVIFTDMQASPDLLREVEARISKARIFVPPILNLPLEQIRGLDDA